MQNSNCILCANYLKNGQCLAFPNGIPDVILIGDFDHKTKLASQKNDIVFEPIEKNDDILINE